MKIIWIRWIRGIPGRAKKYGFAYAKRYFSSKSRLPCKRNATFRQQVAFQKFKVLFWGTKKPLRACGWRYRALKKLKVLFWGTKKPLRACGWRYRAFGCFLCVRNIYFYISENISIFQKIFILPSYEIQKKWQPRKPTNGWVFERFWT